MITMKDKAVLITVLTLSYGVGQFYYLIGRFVLAFYFAYFAFVASPHIQLMIEPLKSIIKHHTRDAIQIGFGSALGVLCIQFLFQEINMETVLVTFLKPFLLAIVLLMFGLLMYVEHTFLSRQLWIVVEFMIAYFFILAVVVEHETLYMMVIYFLMVIVALLLVLFKIRKVLYLL